MTTPSITIDTQLEINWTALNINWGEPRCVLKFENKIVSVLD